MPFIISFCEFLKHVFVKNLFTCLFKKGESFQNYYSAIYYKTNKQYFIVYFSWEKWHAMILMMGYRYTLHNVLKHVNNRLVVSVRLIFTLHSLKEVYALYHQSTQFQCEFSISSHIKLKNASNKGMLICFEKKTTINSL